MPVFLLPMILQLIVGLPALIKTAEKAFSGKKGSGKAKKKLVMDSAKAALAVAAQIEKTSLKAQDQTIILSAVSQLTDSTVATLNAVDALRK